MVLYTELNESFKNWMKN